MFLVKAVVARAYTKDLKMGTILEIRLMNPLRRNRCQKSSFKVIK